MKRSTLIFIAVFSSACSIAFAEDQAGPQADTQQPDFQQQGMGRGDHQGIMDGNKMEMMGGGKMGKMGGMMMHPSVVATSDGGVVILQGNKLAKYDSSLNLVKEVELRGGPKPVDKKSDSTEIKKPWTMPQEEQMAPSSSEPSGAPPASETAWAGKDAASQQ